MLAAVGQGRLIHLYQELFGTKSVQVNYYFTDGEIWTGLFENGKWISGTKYGPGEAPHDLIQ